MESLIARYLGVCEIVDRKFNACVNASLVTAAMMLLSIVTFVFFSFDFSYSVIPSRTILLLFFAASVLYWLINYVFYWSSYAGPILTTPNSNVGFEDSRDFFYSLGFYPRSRAAANRALGILEVYRSGVRGLVSLKWNNIVAIERTNLTDILLTKKNLAHTLGRILRLDVVLLRFQSAGDAEQFAQLANDLVEFT